MMVLQKLILPASSDYPEMFYRGSLNLMIGECVSFDTYFNSFSFTKYRKYTMVRNVTFACEIAGEAILQLCVFDGEEHIICETRGRDILSISVKLSELPENGFLYPKLTAITECGILGGSYSSECIAKAIDVCIAICTFKREKFVLRNINELKGAEFSFIRRAFVVDNGNTLDCHELSDEFVTVVYNKNFGGSGGFTRGLIEASDAGYSHVILMDDDVEFYSETLEQMTVFMSLLTEEYNESWFSAAMLPLDKPWEQFELGAKWDNGVTSMKNKVDVRELPVLMDNLDNDNVNYGAWWCLCMPLSIVKINALPIPFFIKYDDIEYGLRKPVGTEIITMNSIAVMHEAFDRKVSAVMDYYHLRNEMVTMALYNKNGLLAVVKRFLFVVGKTLTRLRYEDIPLVLLAAEQFLCGTDFFLNGDEEQNNAMVYSLAEKYVPLDTISEYDVGKRCENLPENKIIKIIMAITLGGHLIPAFMLKKEIIAVPASQAGAVALFRRKAIIQYQLGSNMGILTKRSFIKFLKYGFKAAGMALRILMKYKKVKKDYICHKNEITSQEFWRHHLEIE